MIFKSWRTYLIIDELISQIDMIPNHCSLWLQGEKLHYDRNKDSGYTDNKGLCNPHKMRMK